MNRLGWVVLLLLGALALAAYQGRSRPPRVPAAASEPASSFESPSASAPAAPDPRPANGSRDQRHPGRDAGGSPLTEPGTTAGIEGILAGSKTTPHVEDAAQKARNAMRNMREADERERAALGGGGGSASGHGQPSRPAEEP